VVGELESAVPGQRPAQLGGKGLDVAGQGGDDLFGGAAFGEADQHHEPSGALDQGRARTHPSAAFRQSSRSDFGLHCRISQGWVFCVVAVHGQWMARVAC
jgi:hypothetical protein